MFFSFGKSLISFCNIKHCTTFICPHHSIVYICPELFTFFIEFANIIMMVFAEGERHAAGSFY